MISIYQSTDMKDLVKELGYVDIREIFEDEIEEEKKEQLRNIVSEIDDYDCGLINDYGGGNIQWWQDYISSVIQQCNDYWRESL